MTAGLPLMKDVLASLAKSVLISLGLTDATIQKKKKKKIKIRYNNINNFKRRNGKYYENLKNQDY